MTLRDIRRTTSATATAMLWIGLVLWVVGCTPQPAGAPAANRSLATVAAAEESLTAAGHTILACYTVPRCNAAAPKAQIKAAYDTAYTSVTEAQRSADNGGTPDMTASAAALSALQALLSHLPPISSN